MSHKVLRFVKFCEYDEENKLHLFIYKDILNLIKSGERVGVFEVLKNGM